MTKLYMAVAAIIGLSASGTTSAWENGATRTSISEALLAAIHAKARTANPVNFTGISDFADGRQTLHITSDRAMAAWEFATNSSDRSIGDGGEYLDTVSINCGDEEASQPFECIKVTVKAPDGRTIKPLSYLAGTASYENLRGEQWQVREVDASYAAAELRNGFSVEYVSADGVERTFAISDRRAADSLLLNMESMAER